MFRPPVGSGRGDEDESGRRRHSSRVKFLPLAWAGMPKTSFRKNSDSPRLFQRFSALCANLNTMDNMVARETAAENPGNGALAK